MADSELAETQMAGNELFFVAEDGKAKSQDLTAVVKKMERIVRHERLTYEQFAYVCKVVRGQLDLKPKKKRKKLPVLLTDKELERFFETIDDCGNMVYQLMLRLLFFCGVRVSELVSIRLVDVFLDESKIFIKEGKGDKDRYVLMPRKLKLALSAFMQAHPDQVYLFESNRRKSYSPRRVQQLVKEFQEKAGIEKRMHPHLLRHQALSFLTKKGLTDAQIQLVSGHASKKSLEVYQHLALEDVQDDYEAAMRDVRI
jgi:integrase/recombinase XerD